MKRASALIMALWTIAILSIMVLSFATEAHIETGINVYVRERNRVSRLIEAGQTLGEIVLTGFSSVAEWDAEQDVDEELEKDRWFLEKQQLKIDGKCTIGPILLDEESPESGTITIYLSQINSGGSEGEKKGVIDINSLCKAGGDAKYQERWWMIFRLCGIPEEFSTKDDGRINLWNELIASWDDWTDEDDLVTAIDGEECGAENDWYEEYEEEHEIEDEDRKRPRNASVSDVKEIGYVRGFRDYPQILYGGTINPWEHKDGRIDVKGILPLLSTEGGQVIDVNDASIEALVTVPGVYRDPDEDEAYEDALAVAQAIIDGKKVEPEWEHDETRSEWPYRDWQDLLTRVEEVDSSIELGGDAEAYFSFKPGADTIFRMRIVGESMGMLHSVEALCYVKDKSVRYIEWNEEPGGEGK